MYATKKQQQKTGFFTFINLCFVVCKFVRIDFCIVTKIKRQSNAF